MPKDMQIWDSNPHTAAGWIPLVILPKLSPYGTQKDKQGLEEKKSTLSKGFLCNCMNTKFISGLHDMGDLQRPSTQG